MRVITGNQINRSGVLKLSQNLFSDQLLDHYLKEENASIWVKKRGGQYRVVVQIDRSAYGFAKFKSQHESLASAFHECEKKMKRWVVRCKDHRGRKFYSGIKKLTPVALEA